MKKIIVLLFVVSGFISAQNEFTFEFDYAQFGYDATSNYLEYYYSFAAVENDSVAERYFGMDLLITTEGANADTIVNKRYRIKDNQQKLTSGLPTSLVGVVSFVLPEGKYNIKSRGYLENNPEEVKETNSKVNIVVLYDTTISISNIELATNIVSQNANKESLFYKNTLEVVPNPITVYTTGSPVVFFYSEIYNLFAKGETSPYLLKRTVTNSRGRVINKKEKALRVSEKAIVEIGLVNMRKYATDTYTIDISVFDTTTGKGVSSSKKFFLINPGIKDTLASEFVLADYLASEYGIFSEEELDDMFSKCRYIATSAELDQYEILDSVDSKRQYFYEFWAKRDPNLKTPQNEYKDEYMKRLDHVNIAYTSSYRPGYKTDMGRVYLMYGEPDQIDRYPNETNVKPYEIWYYNNIEGGVNFIFADISGFAQYELLSSTKRGEITDENWITRIYTN